MSFLVFLECAIALRRVLGDFTRSGLRSVRLRRFTASKKKKKKSTDVCSLLKPFAFVLAGVLGKGYSAEKIIPIIHEHGGRVYSKSNLPPEELPVNYVVITSQREVDKQANKLIANINAAYRRNWELLSVSFIIDTHKTGILPDKEQYRLDVSNLARSSQRSIVNAALPARGTFSKVRSGLCKLKRKRKEQQGQSENAVKRKHRRISKKASKFSGYTMFYKEKYGDCEGDLLQRSKLIAIKWTQLSAEEKAT